MTWGNQNTDEEAAEQLSAAWEVRVRVRVRANPNPDPNPNPNPDPNPNPNPNPNQAGVNFLDTAEGYPVPMTAERQGATDRAIGRCTLQP